MIRNKSDIIEAFTAFVRRFTAVVPSSYGTMTVPLRHENDFNEERNYIRKIHSDNAMEFKRLGYDLGDEVNKSYSPPYIPELISIAYLVNITIE